MGKTKIHYTFMLCLLCCSCGLGDSQEKSIPIEGKWERVTRTKTIKISLKKDLFSYTVFDGDLISYSKGKYTLSRNEKREVWTLTLIPDLTYFDEDTIMKSCKNFDIKYLDDSIMVVKLPSRYLNIKMADTSLWYNPTEVFKRVE